MEGDISPEVAAAANEEQVYEDYFGFDENKTWFFPDKKQYIIFKVMSEGDKAKFQRETNRDITLQRSTGDAKIKADPASERWALLDASVIDWHVFRDGQPVPFTKGSPGATFNQWLSKANPRLVEDLEFEIRKANPWLQADMTLEDVDKEMDRLRELREEIVKRESGK